MITFSVVDRLSIKNLYPNESTLVNQVYVRDIEKKIGFTQDDIKNFEIIFNEEKKAYEWNVEKAKDIKVKLTNEEIVFLRQQIDRLDKEGKIRQSMVELCLKIKEGQSG